MRILILMFVLVLPVKAQDFDNSSIEPWRPTEPLGVDTGVGQVVMTDAANPFLHSFSFWLAATEQSDYQAHLAIITPDLSFGGSGISPFNIIWSSSVLSIPGDPSAPEFTFFLDPNNVFDIDEFVRVDFAAELLLDPSLTYAAFLSPTSSSSNLALAFQSLGASNGLITREDTWFTNSIASGIGEATDAARTRFSADFCESAETCLPAVPVPAAFWLFGTGILGLIGFSRRRKAT